MPTPSPTASTNSPIVALHRAVFLARRRPEAQILVTTFSSALANALQLKLNRLVGNGMGTAATVENRIQVRSIRGIAYELYVEAFGEPAIARAEWLRSHLVEIANQIDGHHFTEAFFWGEWHDIADAWQVDDWEAYRKVKRLGRKTRLGNKQREILWLIFRQLMDILNEQQQITWAGLFRRVTDHLVETETYPFDFAIVDEAQDLGIPELRFLAKLGSTRPDSLFFTGDLGQRIFQQPYSWNSLGVNIRGRSQTLKINYRTSHQIRQQADRLLPSSIADVDGNVEQRDNTISVFNGPIPEVKICDNDQAEIQLVSQWISNRLTKGLQPDEIGIFVRSQDQLQRAISAIKQAEALPAELDDQIMPSQGCIALSTMHLAKGLEFRAVAVMACDDEVIPLQDRIETISDEADLTEVYNTERHLLYVACTRARDDLMISGVEPVSEFLEDLQY